MQNSQQSKEDAIYKGILHYRNGYYKAEFTDEKGKKHLKTLFVSPYEGKNENCYKHYIDGKLVDACKFMNSAHFYTIWMVYDIAENNRAFYLSYADDKKIIAGEAIKPNIGQYKWQNEFTRVAPDNTYWDYEKEDLIQA